MQTRRLSKTSVAALLAGIVVSISAARPAIAAFGDCGQPISSGDIPVAGDCLAVLQAAVAIRECDNCICDVNGSGTTTATDALICLRKAIGLDVVLACGEDCTPRCVTPTCDVLDCERLGYPCTLGDVSPDIQESADGLADVAADMIEAGASFADARSWLETQPGLVEMSSDDRALRFRLEGGRPTWVLSAEALAPFVTNSAPLPITRPPAPSLPVSAPIVVGMTPDTKRALLLSPFSWFFPDEFLETRPLAEMLANTRGYLGHVTSLENLSADAADVTVDSFRGWSSYDLVHLITHGHYVCDDSGCRAILMVSPRGAAGSAAETRGLEVEGGEYVRLSIADQLVKISKHYVALGADFFRAEYPTGVGNAIVFLNTCKSYHPQATDIADALQGDMTSVLGWTETVGSAPAYAAAMALYSHLLEGVRLETALDLIGDLATSAATQTTLVLGKRRSGGDHRLREIVWLEHPDTQAPLTDGDMVTIQGLVDDGLPDAVPFLVRVDGVDRPADEFTFHVSIGDSKPPPYPLSAGEQVGEREWRVAGQVNVGRDLTAGEVLDVRAWVNLPDEGTSEMTASIVVPGGDYWEGEIVNFYQSSLLGQLTNVEAVAQVRFDPTGPPDDYTGVQRYEVSAGTLMWTRSGSVPVSGEDCTYTYGPVMVPLPIGNGRLEIDHSNNPATYYGFASLDGPSVEIPTSCEDFSFTTRINPVWFYTVDDASMVSIDGNVIQGQSASGKDTWEWSLQRYETGPGVSKRRAGAPRLRRQ